MANYYVRSSAGGAANGTSWANAYTTIVAAMSGKAAGDVFWVADDHAETQGSAMAVTSPGTAASPCKILCVNTHATEPPTGLAATATITTTGNFSMTFTGYAYTYGITYSAGTGVVFAGIIVSQDAWIFDTCVLKIPGTAAGGINLGSAGGNERVAYIEFINTQVQFSVAGHGIVTNGNRFIWRNTVNAVLGTVPTVLFRGAAASDGDVEVSGVDLSALGSGKSLVNVAIANSAVTRYLFRNCKLGASVSALSGAILGPGGTLVNIENCDSGDTNYRMELYRYAGSIVQETTIKKTAGASDGTTPLSWKMVSLAGCSFLWPLYSPPIYLWNESTSSQTLTVEILHNSATNLDEGECWLEVEYLSTSGFPISALITDHNSTPISVSTTDQTSGTGTGNWTTTGLANANSQKLSVTFTAQEKGVLCARVVLGKASYTVYVDPVLDNGSGAGRRQYLVPGGSQYLNEAATTGIAVLTGGGIVR